MTICTLPYPLYGKHDAPRASGPGKLAKEYPQLKALNIDDFSANVPKVFSESVCAAIRDGLDGRVKLMPTHYHGAGADGFVLKREPWLAKATDGVLFYFRNEKGGQAECGRPSSDNGGLCTAPDGTVPTTADTSSSSSSPSPPSLPSPNSTEPAGESTQPCTMCCLSGSRAEASLPNLASEIADFSAVLPPSHPLHIGLYFSGVRDRMPFLPSRLSPLSLSWHLSHKSLRLSLSLSFSTLQRWLLLCAHGSCRAPRSTRTASHPLPSTPSAPLSWPSPTQL